MSVSFTSILCTIRSFLANRARNLLRPNKALWLFCVGFLSFVQVASSQCTDPIIALNPTPGNCLNGLNLKASGGYTSYRWLLDEVEIYGETDSILNTLYYGNGDYKAIGTGGTCAPSDTSAFYTVTCEICGNGLDDDGDGDADCDDPECAAYAGCTDCDSDGVADNVDLCYCDMTVLGALNGYGCGFPDSCAFKVIDTLVIDTAGVNYLAGYITVYILTDSVGEIVDTSLVPEFTDLVPGKFMVVALDYEDDGSITNLAIGNDLNTVTANCYEISNAMTLKVCPEEDCGDGVDNDDDNLVDCDDPDCAPVAGIIFSNTTACPNENISFVSDSTIVSATYSWRFGDGAVPSTATGVGNHNVIYSTCGNKEVILDVLENGCTVSDTVYIDIIDTTDPTFTVPADVTVNYNSTCALDTTIADLGDVLDEADNCTNCLMTISGVNLALGGTATQSSTGFSGVASRAIDGNTNGNYSGGNSVTHTNNEANAWWELDMGAVEYVGMLELWNRTDCCSGRLSDFYIFISDVPFTSQDLTTTLNQPSVFIHRETSTVGVSETIPVNRTGRYVRVQLAGSGILSLAEVRVLCNNSLEATYTDDVSGLTGCNNTGTFTRTWRLEDDCGNVTTQIQTVTVIDTEAPSFTVPADVTVNLTATCTLDTTTADIGSASVFADNCSSCLAATYTDDVSGLTGCNNTGTFTRTWRLEDDCGNVTTQIQTVTVIDTEAPRFTVPADVMVNLTATCTLDTTTADIGSASVIDDNCSSGLAATYTD
ncbi:MAG: discoidin domain-containing protein, partial [Bacteroidota bacterium]